MGCWFYQILFSSGTVQDWVHMEEELSLFYGESGKVRKNHALGAHIFCRMKHFIKYLLVIWEEDQWISIYLWEVHSTVTKMLTGNYCGYVECKGQKGQPGTMHIVWGVEEDSQIQWCLSWMRSANRTLLSQAMLSCRWVWAGQCLPHSQGF